MSEFVWEWVGDWVSKWDVTELLFCIFSLKEKLKTLAQLLHRALFSDGDAAGRESGERGKETSLQRLIMDTMIRWAQQPIHSPELIQQIFALLYRQCDEINEVVSPFDLLREQFVVVTNDAPTCILPLSWDSTAYAFKTARWACTSHTHCSFSVHKSELYYRIFQA